MNSYGFVTSHLLGTILEPSRNHRDGALDPIKRQGWAIAGLAAPTLIIILIKGGARRIYAPAPWDRGASLISIIRGPLGHKAPLEAHAWAPL